MNSGTTLDLETPTYAGRSLDLRGMPSLAANGLPVGGPTTEAAVHLCNVGIGLVIACATLMVARSIFRGKAAKRPDLQDLQLRSELDVDEDHRRARFLARYGSEATKRDPGFAEAGQTLTLARSFGRREDGNVAITFALALLPLLILAGAGIDYGRATAERDKLQQGSDAAVLAGIQALRRGESLQQAGQIANQVVATNDANPYAAINSLTLSPDGTQLCVQSQSQIATTLMNVVGYTSLTVGGYACAKMRPDTYEIALAMDNSASMSNSAQSGGQTKMQAAQQAAVGLIQALAPSPNGSVGVTAYYSVVPFSSSVNVGPSNRGASWLDMNGKSSIHWKSFTYVPPVIAQYNLSLFSALDALKVAWGGCVEERPSPYTTSDDPPSSSAPDTLFVPFFSPDEADQNQTAKSTGNSKYNQYTFNNYLTDQSGSCQPGDDYDQADQKYGRGDGQTKLCKYTSQMSANGNTYYVTGQAAGPNAGCATPAMTPLNATQSTVTDAINAMRPVGDTALAPGFMWAWRAISPNGAFASTGSRWSTSGAQQPKPYGYIDPTTTGVNHKVVILLTDGMNDWFGQDGDQVYTGGSNITQYDNNKMVYNSFGYPQDGRLTNGNANATTSTARSVLDQTTAAACAAAKRTLDPNGNAAPVEIYTVGLLASDGIDQAGRDLLANCATDANHAFLATTGADLVSVFQKIASQITQPRLVQ